MAVEDRQERRPVGYSPLMTPLAPPEKPNEVVAEVLKELEALPPERQLEALRIRRARLHPSDFNAYCFTRPDGQKWQQTEFHREWLDELMTYVNYEARGLQHKVQIEAFREAAKTEQVSIGYALWRLGKNHNLRIKVVSADDELAKSIISTAGQHIKRNEALRTVFPSLRPDLEGQWNSERIIVERSATLKDASFEAHGVLSSGVGGRCDLLIFDDICNYRNTWIQPAMKKMIITSVEDVWMKLATPTAQVIWLDTPWAPDDASATIAGYQDFKHIRHPVYRYFRNPQTGEVRKESRWPEKYSMEFLLNEEATRSVSFRRNMLLQRSATRGESYFPEDVVEGCKLPPYVINDPSSMYHDMGLGPPERGHVYLSVWDLGRHVNRKGRNATVCLTFDVTTFPFFVRHAKAYYDIPYTSPDLDSYSAANEIRRISELYPGETVVEVNAGGEATVESMPITITPFRTSSANKTPMLEHLLNEMKRGAIVWQACDELEELEAQLKNYTLQDDTIAQDWVITMAIASMFLVIEGGSGIVI